MLSTLRGRLSLWYLASIGFIFLFFAVAISSIFWVTLQDQIDHHVHIAVNEAHQIVQNYRGEERDDLIRTLVSAQGMTVVVLSPDGAPTLETNSPDVALVTEHQLQQIMISTSLNDSSPTHFTESNIRFAAMPVQINAGKGIVAVGYSTEVLYTTFYKILIVVASAVVLLVLPITFFGYRLLKRQLQPLESIANQAMAVSDLSSLSKRIIISSPTKELKTIQTAINSMLAQLEQFFKSEREFFSDAAHTLKTPLAVLRSQIESSRLAQKSREDLLATVDSTNDTIQDLLFLSKIGNKSENIKMFSLSALMIDLSELASTLGEDKILQVSSDIQKNVNIKADKKLLQRALSNIIYNAVTYNKTQGTISLNLKQKSDCITIAIKDTGVGIKKNERTKVFTRFFRGSNAISKGSGLGLAISRAVIENLGGRISLNSSPNESTAVTITL